MGNIFFLAMFGDLFQCGDHRRGEAVHIEGKGQHQEIRVVNGFEHGLHALLRIERGIDLNGLCFDAARLQLLEKITCQVMQEVLFFVRGLPTSKTAR